MRRAALHPPSLFVSSSVAAALMILLAALVLPGPVDAHVPVLEPESASDAPAVPGDPFPGAIPIPDPSVSRALYGVLSPGEDLDAYRFTVAQPITIPLSMLVPHRDELRDFRPSFAILGPTGVVGSPGSAAVPVELERRLWESGYGEANAAPSPFVADGPSGERSTFFEPFSFERYWEGQEATVTLEPEVTYHLVVYDPRGQTGDYVVGLGEAEAWSVGDMGRTTVAIARIKLGLYGQGDLRTGFLAAMVGTVVGVAALAVMAAYGVRRLRRR